MNGELQSDSGADHARDLGPATSRLATAALLVSLVTPGLLVLDVAFSILFELLKIEIGFRERLLMPISVFIYISLFMLSPAAVVCGHLAVRRINKAGEALTGKTRARIGAAFGYLGLIVLAGSIVLAYVFVRAEQPSDTSNAVATIRAIKGAQDSYRGRNGQYAATVDELLTAFPSHFEGNWEAKRRGYHFTMISDGKQFRANADPVEPARSDARHFMTDESGVIRWRTGSPADAQDRPLGD